MSEIQILTDPYIVSPKGKHIASTPYWPGMTVWDATKDARDELKRLGFDDFVVTINGHLCQEMSRKVRDSDFIAVHVKHGDPGTAILAFTIFWGNTFLATALNAVILMGVGLLINTIMAPSVPGNNTGDTKPSYSWGGVTNETAPGNPVPVVYGQPWSTPQIIGSYRIVDNHNVWQYLLMCAAAGKTDVPITENYTTINDELVSAYTDYKFGATDGSTVITDDTREALADFDKVHHDRPFDKRLRYTDISDAITTGLTHFDSATGDIEDSTLRGVPDWTKHGNAVISTTSPKFGTGLLSLPADGDYISSTDLEALRIDVEGEIDMWFKIPNTDGDRALWSKIINLGGPGPMYDWSVTTCGIRDGKIFLQSIRGEGLSIEQVNQEGFGHGWTIGLNIAGGYSILAGTWYFLKCGQSLDGSVMTCGFGLWNGATGALVDGANDSVGEIYNPDPNKSTDSPLDYSDESTAHKALYGQYIGSGYFYNNTPPYDVTTRLYGRCVVDECRTCRLIDGAFDAAIPTAAYPDPTIDTEPDPLVISTRSKVDSVRIIIEFTSGLFDTNDDGLTTRTVDFRIDYRLTGTTGAWCTSTVTCTAEKTAAARFQFQTDFPTRDLYDFRVIRTTAEDDENDNTIRSQSFLISFEEIIDLQLCYPGLQIISLGVRATDSRSGNIGSIRVKHRGTELTVPDWAGTGTQVVDPSIPAWQFFDAFTNPFYGIKGLPSEIDQDRFTEWLEWTEGDVDGVRRAQSHLVFDEVGNFADNAITHIEQVGRARIIRIGSLWSMIVDKPKTSQYTFSSGNILKDSFQWESYEETEKSDAVEVTFWNGAKQGVQDSRMAKASWYETITTVPKISQIEIRGIVTAEQALREAQFRINKNEFVTRHGKHRASFQSVLVELGDVCNIIPPSSKYVCGGRIIRDHVAESTVDIDQAVLFSQTDYEGKLLFLVVDPDGVEHIFNVLGPWDVSTSTLQIDGDYTGNRWDTFGMGRLVEDRLANQIVKKSINTKEKNVDFEWCQYSENIFYHADYGGGLVAI